MIQLAGGKLSQDSARLALRSELKEGEIEAVVRRIIDAALHGEREDIELFLRYNYGRPRIQPLAVPSVDLGTLTTMDGCVEAVERVSDALIAGLIQGEHAEVYLKLIEQAMKGHRTKAADMALDALEGAGALAFFGGADRTPEQVAEDFGRFAEANYGPEPGDN